MTNKVLIEKKGGLFNLRPLYDLFSHSVDGIYQVIVKKVRKPRSNESKWLAMGVHLSNAVRWVA